jgi:hypothetical protein
LHLEKSMAAVASLFDNTKAREVNDVGCSRWLPFSPKMRVYRVVLSIKKHPKKKNNYVEVDFVCSVMDREYMRIHK